MKNLSADECDCLDYQMSCVDEEKPSEHNAAAGNPLTQTSRPSQGAAQQKHERRMQPTRSSLSSCFPSQNPCQRALRGARPTALQAGAAGTKAFKHHANVTSWTSGSTSFHLKAAVTPHVLLFGAHQLDTVLSVRLGVLQPF